MGAENCCYQDDDDQWAYRSIPTIIPAQVRSCFSFPLDLAPMSPRISSNSPFVHIMYGRPFLRPAPASLYTPTLKGNNHIPSPSSFMTL